MSLPVAAAVVSGAGTVSFQGQPCSELRLGSGDRVLVAHHGAHVLSWSTADGAERLYLSPQALIDGVSAIRGGVPLCFPQFNMRVLDGHACPKHGFARTTAWTPQGVQVAADAATATFGLADDTSSRALWPHGFAASLAVHLQPGLLRLEFSVHNTGAETWPFALALHTYLRVDDISRTRLHGLQGLSYRDGVLNLQQPDARHTEARGALAFTAETDRVYEVIQGPLDVHHPGGALRMTQSASLPEAVVWNPAAERCAAMSDMPADGWKHMLCVEAACVNTPVRLAPGQSWSGWQALAVQPAA